MTAYNYNYKEFPSYPDKDLIFEQVIAKPDNKVCFDCGKANPTLVDILYGIFICDECDDFHACTCPPSVHDRISLLLILMNIGGNKRARDFFHQHEGWTDGGDLEANYNSLAAQMYRSKLISEAVKISRKIQASSPASESCTLEDQNPEETNEARRRFPNAKSISSSQFFRVQVETNDTEAKHRLQNFANASAISSADLFVCSAKNCKHEFCGQHIEQVQEHPDFLDKINETWKMMTPFVSRIFGGV